MSGEGAKKSEGYREGGGRTARRGVLSGRGMAAGAPVPVKLLTLVVVRDRGGRRVLLGKKLRGFGAGYFNGFGGKVEAGESVVEAAHRELQEEAGVTAPKGAHDGGSCSPAPARPVPRRSTSPPPHFLLRSQLPALRGGAAQGGFRTPRGGAEGVRGGGYGTPPL